jgi:hypothetical protein
VASQGEFTLQATNDRSVVHDFIDLGTRLDEFGSGGKLQGRPGFLEVQFGRSGAANDRHTGVSRQRWLQDTRQLGVAKVNVGLVGRS